MITKTSFLQPLFFGLLIFGLADSAGAGQTLNGFSTEGSLIEVNAIHKGGHLETVFLLCTNLISFPLQKKATSRRRTGFLALSLTGKPEHIP